MTSEYVVEKIDGKKYVNDTPFYLIKWKGWAKEFNTWEPIENLNGCPKLLEEYELRLAKKSSGRPCVGKRFFEEDEEDMDVEKALADTAEHMRSFGILPEWPADKEPLRVTGVIYVDGKLTYVVKRKTKQRTTGRGTRTGHTRANAILVHADSFRLKYPHIVIAFYEGRASFGDKSKSDEDQANAAAQSALLHQNVGSRRGKMIANDMDSLLREVHDVRKDKSKRVKKEVKVIEEQLIADDEAMEEDEVQEVDEELTRDDPFGLPNNIDHVSSDDSASGSESEREEVDVECKQAGWNFKRPNKTSNQGSSDEDEAWTNWKRGGKTAIHHANDNDDGGISHY